MMVRAASITMSLEKVPAWASIVRRLARSGARSLMRRISSAACDLLKSASLFSTGRMALPSLVTAPSASLFSVPYSTRVMATYFGRCTILSCGVVLR